MYTMKKYKSVRIYEKTHILLKEYCQYHDESIGKVIDQMIKEKIKYKQVLPTVDPSRIMKVNEGT